MDTPSMRLTLVYEKMVSPIYGIYSWRRLPYPKSIYIGIPNIVDEKDKLKDVDPPYYIDVMKVGEKVYMVYVLYGECQIPSEARENRPKEDFPSELMAWEYINILYVTSDYEMADRQARYYSKNIEKRDEKDGNIKRSFGVYIFSTYLKDDTVNDGVRRSEYHAIMAYK